MINGRRIAVTGARGRVGSALVDALRHDGGTVVGLSRPDYDLDDPAAASRVVARERPTIVYHPAAWTDVDGCARNPELALRRNGVATAELADACAVAGAALVYVSTNEVFSGERSDGRGYAEDDAADPRNAYGRSKLQGEEAVRAAFAERPGRAWIVRTSWVFGSPGWDFPMRIVAAADAVVGAQRLRVVHDERGRPTYAADLAAAMIELTAAAPGGTYHLANEGEASRFEWAQRILGRCRPGVELEAITLADYARASAPPRWGVLDTSRADVLGIRMRPWGEPLEAYLSGLCR